MKNVFEFITNKRDYTLHFQNAEYTKNDFECFYSHEDLSLIHISEPTRRS